MSQAHTTKSLVIFHAEGETDAAAVAEFGKHLAPLTSGGQLRVWDFRDIAPGVNRLEAIQAALQGADMVAFWVSPDLWHNHPEFDFVCNTAGLIPPTAQVVPIIARHATWEALPFLKRYIQNAIPANQQPMPTGSKEQEDAWMDELARSVAQKLELMGAPSGTRRFWRKISLGGWLGILGFVVSLLGVWLSYRSYAADRQEYQAQAKKESLSPAPTDAGCGFPVHFVQDTLYVLITRFEDFQNESGSECYGRGIERRIDQLVQSRKIPVVFCYRDDLSPNQSREADRLRDEFHADLIIWGKLRNAGPDCKADGFCLQFNPSDTLIRYVGGEVPTPDLDDFQRSIAASDIEQGLINMGRERFDDWFVGMFNLKIGKRKPELFVIEEAWNKKKKAEAYFARGEIWCHLGHYAEGATDYTNAVENGFTSAKVYHGRGWAKINLKLLDDAVLDLDQAIRLDSHDMVAYCYRGLLKCMRKSFAKGISDYDHAIALAPNSDQAYMARGLAKLSLSHHSEAISDFDRSISLNPKSAHAYVGRGYANMDLGRYGLAVANFNRAEVLKPKIIADNDCAYYCRECIRINAGHYTQVIEDAKQAFKTYPKSPYPYLARGLANCKSGALSKAMIDCNQCIKIYPKCGEAYYVRGMIRRELGQYAEAMNDFNQALSINREHIRAYHERGRIKNKLGRYKEAICDFDQAIAIDSKDASLFTSRGFAKDDLGQYANAVSDYDTAIALSPQYATAYNLRSYSKRRNGQYFSALSDYCYSIWLEPSSGWMWYLALLGAVYSWKSKIINPFLLRLLARFLPQKSAKTPPPHIKSPTTRRRKP